MDILEGVVTCNTDANTSRGAVPMMASVSRQEAVKAMVIPTARVMTF